MWHYNVSVYSMCVWLVLAAWVMRGVRPESMAWFSQSEDESWQLQDCLLLLVCCTNHTPTPHYIYGNNKTLVFIFTYCTHSSRQNIPVRQSRVFILGGSNKPSHPPILSLFLNTTTCLWLKIYAIPESDILSVLHIHSHRKTDVDISARHILYVT